MTAAACECGAGSTALMWEGGEPADATICHTNIFSDTHKQKTLSLDTPSAPGSQTLREDCVNPVTKSKSKLEWRETQFSHNPSRLWWSRLLWSEQREELSTTNLKL